MPRLLVYCLLISFLFHLLFIWLAPKYTPKHEPIPTTPTYVTLEDLPQTAEEKPKEREIDETPTPDQQAPEEASRLAESNQKVDKEMAPRGEDSRDQPPVAASPETPTSEPTPPPPPPPVAETKPEPPKEPAVTAEQKPMDTGILPAEPDIAEEQKTGPKPDLQNLTKLSPDTLQRMDRKEQRERIKKRDDVLEGDAVYLNLQQDFLISFFKRFSNRIESVWNYPDKAARRGEQGVLLLKITVTREGKLLDVELMESSGSDDLDYEATQAIYRAAPFGPITKHWPHDQMKIYAHFQYTLSGKYIYGR